MKCKCSDSKAWVDLCPFELAGAHSSRRKADKVEQLKKPTGVWRRSKTSPRLMRNQNSEKADESATTSTPQAWLDVFWSQGNKDIGGGGSGGGGGVIMLMQSIRYQQTAGEQTLWGGEGLWGDAGVGPAPVMLPHEASWLHGLRKDHRGARGISNYRSWRMLASERTK